MVVTRRMAKIARMQGDGGGVGGDDDEVGDGDRLSNLPVSILQYIFSFLETIDVIRASAVSRKWRYFWVSMPYLSIDYKTAWPDEKFNDFLNWVLMSRNPSANIQSLRLCHSALRDNGTLCRWMDAIAQRNLQELDLKIHSSDEIGFPQCILNCGSLVSLKLDFKGCVFLKQLTFPGFSRLKSLELHFVRFEDPVSLGNLVSSCPILEDLTVDECDIWGLKLLEITAPSLKNLSLNLYCERHYKIDVLKIACPNLVSLNVSNLVSLDFSFQDMNSLQNLFMEFYYPVENVTAAHCGQVMNKILNGVRNVKVMELSLCFEEYLHLAVDEPEWFPASFNNLKSLTLNLGCNDFSKKTLFNLLDCSPNLEALKCSFPSFEECNGGWNLPERTISCLEFHLKTAELISVDSVNYKLDLVRFLLKNGHVMQRMHIRWAWEAGYIDELTSEVMKFPRSSPNVALTFTESEFPLFDD